MKFAIVVVLVSAVVTVASAEPPSYRFRSQQQQAHPAPYPPAGSAPYPPSGSKPSGPLFRLPERQQKPPQTYAAPTTAAPSATTTEGIETTTSARRTGKSSRLSASDDAEAVDTRDSDAEEGVAAAAAPQGVYYIYHPNGLLQRVVYTAGQDNKGNAVTAQLRYENVEPIRGPIFTYDPNTLQLQPIDVNQLQLQ